MTGLAADGMTALLDLRCGIVPRVVREPAHPRMPPGFVRYSAYAGDASQFAPWHNDLIAGGTAFADPPAARWAAIGEAVERYCGNVPPVSVERASFSDLWRAGRHAVDPDRLALYSGEQHASPRFPFVPFTRDLGVGWVPGRTTGDGCDVMVPASLAWLNPGPGAALPVPTNFLVYAGIATGPDRDDAERRALEELLERDAVMLWWLSGAAAARLEPWGRVADELAALPPGVRAVVVAVPSAFPVPVIGVLVVDDERGTTTFGTACRADPEHAALKAFGEALQLQAFAEGLLTADGAVHRAMASGALDPRACRPHRADRRYLDSYRADLSDATDLAANVQLHLDPRARRWTRRISEAPGPAPVPHRVRGPAREAYLTMLSAAGLEAVTVDLTTPDVEPSGLRVVRVVVPGLLLNGPTGLPFLGGERLRDLPDQLGWRSGPLTPSDVVRAPLPYA